MLIRQDFYFNSLGACRPLHVRLPDCPGRFPVMYFFDGHNLFRDEDATYGKSWGMDAFCSAWDKQMIVVGLECAHEGDRRLSEYLPYGCSCGWLKGIEPLGEATMQAILTGLKPYVDASFPTIPFRECTGIGGSSMGGLMAAYAVVRHNRWFSKAACVSPSLGPVFGKFRRELGGTEISPDTRVFLSWGTMEGFFRIRDPWKADRESRAYRTCRAFAEGVAARGGTARLFCQIGGKHCEADWEKQIPLFMPFLWQEG